jgi:hypothetical protein
MCCSTVPRPSVHDQVHHRLLCASSTLFVHNADSRSPPPRWNSSSLRRCRPLPVKVVLLRQIVIFGPDALLISSSMLSGHSLTADDRRRPSAAEEHCRRANLRHPTVDAPPRGASTVLKLPDAFIPRCSNLLRQPVSKGATSEHRRATTGRGVVIVQMACPGRRMTHAGWVASRHWARPRCISPLGLVACCAPWPADSRRPRPWTNFGQH